MRCEQNAEILVLKQLVHTVLERVKYYDGNGGWGVVWKNLFVCRRLL
jgi:hypothetical protein